MSATLTPFQSRILDAFAAVHFSVPDLLASLKLSATDFLAWAGTPAVSSALDTLRAALAAAHDLRHLSLRELTLSALASVLNDSNSPAEIRRSATTLLATLDRPPPPAPRAASPTPPTPRAASHPLPSPTSAPTPAATPSRPVQPAATHPPRTPAAPQPAPIPNTPLEAVTVPGVTPHPGTNLRRESLPAAPLAVPTALTATTVPNVPAAPPLIPRSLTRAASLLARAGAPSRPP